MADSAQKYTFLQQVQNIANAMANLDAQIKDATAAGSTPTRPAIPSIIITCNFLSND